MILALATSLAFLVALVLSYDKLEYRPTICLYRHSYIKCNAALVGLQANDDTCVEDVELSGR